MSDPPAGISEPDWLAWPTSARFLIVQQQQEIQVLRQENEQFLQQLTALATELSCLRERIGRSSRNSSKPPSSDGPGFKPPERRKGSGRKRAVSRAIPALARSCCRGSALTKWWSTTRMPAAAAAPCCKERIQRRCATR